MSITSITYTIRKQFGPNQYDYEIVEAQASQPTDGRPLLSVEELGYEARKAALSQTTEFKLKEKAKKDAEKNAGNS